MSRHKIWVLYHADCMDGYAAAWAVWKALGNQALYKAVRYDAPIPDFPDGATLYIVDFCYSPEALVTAAQRATQIVVLDHHLSAKKAFDDFLNHATLPDNLMLHFDLMHSGCLLAWHYFHAQLTPPVLLQHIEDHDLWLHKMPHTEAICKALYLKMSTRFEAFEQLEIADLQRDGAVLLKQQQFAVQRLLKARHAVQLHNVKGLAVNAPPMFASDLGQALATLSGTFGLTYSYHGKRACYECGLRSIDTFDVSELAKHFGGGGHRNAAGFSADKKTFFSFFR